jgi:hypothetical protein
LHGTPPVPSLHGNLASYEELIEENRVLKNLVSRVHAHPDLAAVANSSGVTNLVVEPPAAAEKETLLSNNLVQTVPGRLVYSRAEDALPKPQVLTADMVRKFHDNPEAASAFLVFAISWLKARGLPLHNLIGYMGATVGLSWSQQVFANDPTISSDEFSKLFLSRFTGQVRSQATLALEKLVSRAVTQGHDDMGVYAAKFNQVARLLPNESQVSLCQHFISGMQADLRAACCLDLLGDEWDDLQKCIKFSIAASIRASRSAEALNASHSRPTHAKDKSRSQDESSFKKAKTGRWGGPREGLTTAVGPQGLVAAVKTVASSSRTDKRPYKPPAEIELIKGDQSSKIPLPPPGPNIPGFLSQEKPLSERTRDSLRLYWICTYCRGDYPDGGRHFASSCPKK